MGIDKREAQRFRKRLQLRYGETEPTRIGFAEDLSATGIFIKSVQISPPNTVLIVQLTTTTQELIRVKARVMWAKKVPQNMAHRIKGGMGVHFIRFEEGEAVYRRVCDSLKR
jgi:Tfp pilus assembly protein PilZ